MHKYHFKHSGHGTVEPCCVQAVVNDKAGVSLDLLQVKVAAGMGIVHQVHRGSSPEGVMMYAGVWGRQHDRNDDVQVRSAPLDVRETSTCLAWMSIGITASVSLRPFALPGSVHQAAYILAVWTPWHECWQMHI